MEVGHLQVVSGHPGDEVRLVFKFHTCGLEALKSGLDIVDTKIQKGTGMIEFGLLGCAEHQAHAAAIEKAQLAGAEEMRYGENVTIERGGAIDVVNVDGDLHDARESGIGGNDHVRAS
jgi:hypothetical protein